MRHNKCNQWGRLSDQSHAFVHHQELYRDDNYYMVWQLNLKKEKKKKKTHFYSFSCFQIHYFLRGLCYRFFFFQKPLDEILIIARPDRIEHYTRISRGSTVNNSKTKKLGPHACDCREVTRTKPTLAFSNYNIYSYLKFQPIRFWQQNFSDHFKLNVTIIIY